MTSRPIIFSAPMIRAIAANRKTITRRILNPQPDMAKLSPPYHPEARSGRRWVFMQRTDFPEYQFAGADFTVPYAVGDTLWVRETWRTLQKRDGIAPRYLADDIDKIDYRSTSGRNPLWAWGVWRSPIHMPRWASRLSLRITAVRVERLHDIGEDDAKAEGIYQFDAGDLGLLYAFDIAGKISIGDQTAICAKPAGWSKATFAYCHLWDRIHGQGSWDANPWVIAITFEKDRMT